MVTSTFQTPSILSALALSCARTGSPISRTAKTMPGSSANGLVSIAVLLSGCSLGDGGHALIHYDEVRERLVGFTLPIDTLPAEGAQVVHDGVSTGRVTSARVSERLGKVIGFAWVQPERADEGETIAIRIDGVVHDAAITLAPFYDPEGALLRS
jgi:hypothetical protein